MGMLFHFQGAGPLLLDCIPQAVQGTNPWVTSPGKDQLPRATGADELIVYQVWRQPDQCQIAPALPNDFVPGGKRNQMREAFEGNSIAITHSILDGFSEVQYVSQGFSQL
jgi:hypothetical protein